MPVGHVHSFPSLAKIRQLAYVKAIEYLELQARYLASALLIQPSRAPNAYAQLISFGTQTGQPALPDNSHAKLTPPVTPKARASATLASP